MAFIASVLPLQQGFQNALSVAGQEKIYLQGFSTRLTGNITALDATDLVANLNRVISALDQIAALPGLQAYAQQQFGNANYDVATEYNNMRTALNSVLTWLKTNVPSNAVSISNGVITGQTYAPAATASLKTLVDAAVATIA